jgi:hypothetical protein
VKSEWLVMLSKTATASQETLSQLMTPDLAWQELLAAACQTRRQCVIGIANLLAAIHAGDEGGDHRFASAHEKGMPMSRVECHP